MNTETETTAENKNFLISNAAAKRIKFLVEQEEDQNSFLRIMVDGGGCSGFQYEIKIDNKISDEDLIFENNGSKVIIDTTSFEFVQGSAIDFVETLGSAQFEVTNPNATANCGCGNSFSV